MPDLLAVLPRLVPTLTNDLLRYLASRFPGSCPGDREDAVQDALTQIVRSARTPSSVLCRAWREHGLVGARRFAHRVAWRQLRCRLRRKGATWEPLEHHASSTGDPDAELWQKRALCALDDALEEVGPLFAPRSPDALHLALLESLEGGAADAEVAARHGLRREPLCRARRWVRDRMVA